MLSNPDIFSTVEKFLLENGTIPEFESENGPIKGRMMISSGEVPPELEIKCQDAKRIQTFVASFDFFDAELSMILSLDPISAVSGVWVTPQVEDAEPPTNEWVEFFVSTLVSNIEPDGSYGLPMYTFISDTADFTVVPAKPD